LFEKQHFQIYNFSNSKSLSALLIKSGSLTLTTTDEDETKTKHRHSFELSDGNLYIFDVSKLFFAYQHTNSYFCFLEKIKRFF
jgi:hypothetical protein